MAKVDQVMLTIRCPIERRDRINARAKAAGLTRSQYVLNRADPEGATTRATTPEAMAVPTVACTHPKATLQVYGWGTICGTCKAKIR